MTRGECVKKVLSDYRKEVSSKEIRAAANLNELLNKDAAFKKARQDYSRARIKQLSAKLSGDDYDIEGFKDDYIKALNNACKKYKISRDSLEIKYNCDKCSDTGFVGSIQKKHCICMINRVNDMMIESQNLVDEYRFENMMLDIYPNDNIIEKIGISQREQMSKIKNILLNWCENYPSIKKNQMLIGGDTGVGKTYLLNCIAHAIMQKGYSVVMTTASAVNDAAFMQIKENDNTLLYTMKNTDLLIIDDLGAEARLKNITEETLYQILEYRLNKKLYTVVSTNFVDAGHIESRYGYRIYSRLVLASNTRKIIIHGRDLR